jgi:hypothetical protein
VAFCGDFSVRAAVPPNSESREGLRKFDKHCFNLMLSCGRAFASQPIVAYIRDEGRKNAYAQPGMISLGAVLFIDLYAREFRRRWFRTSSISPMAVVMAHEFAHIVQFKRRLPDHWRCEPHADFLAGWYLGRTNARADDLDLAVRTMFRFGDWAMNSTWHHGTPHYRARMVRAGYMNRMLDLDAAYEEGLKVVGLA